jgi:hypothetical protein
MGKVCSGDLLFAVFVISIHNRKTSDSLVLFVLGERCQEFPA